MGKFVRVSRNNTVHESEVEKGGGLDNPWKGRTVQSTEETLFRKNTLRWSLNWNWSNRKMK